jgi:selenide,water dikinase
MPDEPPVTRAERAILVVYQEGNAAWSANTTPEGAFWVPSSPQEGGGFGRRLRTIFSMTALTGLTAGGGCAAKYSASRLEELLRGFVPVEAENLLVGLSPADDAAVYKLDDERALVFTLDFFPPLVDDPATFGRIAATNALNDVFAMGGAPLLALSIAAFPEELPTEVLGAVFAAAAVQVREAGAILAGGHTIRDAEPKYGLAVVGTVHPDGIWPKSGAQPGDALFITKPLGTGLVLAAKGDIVPAVEQMTTLNGAAADVVRPFLPNAVTDVTGFGLFGHAHEMAERSGVRIVLDDVPALPGALEAARAGIRTGGDPRNREFAPIEADGAPEELLALGYDAQTAGGLLISLPADKSLSLQAEFGSRGLYLRRVGAVREGHGLALTTVRP